MHLIIKTNKKMNSYHYLKNTTRKILWNQLKKYEQKICLPSISRNMTKAFDNLFKDDEFDMLLLKIK